MSLLVVGAVVGVEMVPSTAIVKQSLLVVVLLVLFSVLSVML